MPKKYRSSTEKRRSVSNRATGIHTWTRDENTPFPDTEYPFERPIFLGEYGPYLHHDTRSGAQLFPSTICLSRQDALDALVLIQLGEQFREFYPGEVPWIRTSTEQMSTAMMLSRRHVEEGLEELNDTLHYLTEKGFLDLDRSTPGTYRYRLNVDAVREAKNACFRPMNALEQIEHDYIRRFPDTVLQVRAFILICENNQYQGYILFTAWDRSFWVTDRIMKHATGKLRYVDEGAILTLLPPTVPDAEKRQQALEALVKKGLLKLKVHGSSREYCPNVQKIWKALEKLPQDLRGTETMDGMGAADDGSPVTGQ